MNAAEQAVSQPQPAATETPPASLPADLEAWPTAQVSAGRFADRGEALAQAVSLLRRHEAGLDELRTEIQVGTDQLDAGRGDRHRFRGRPRRVHCGHPTPRPRTGGGQGSRGCRGGDRTRPVKDYTFAPDARRDLDEAWEHLNQFSRVAADRLVRDVTFRTERLAQLPGTGRSRAELRPGLRSVNVGDHVLFCRIVDRDEVSVEVLRLIHGRRNMGAVFPAAAPPPAGRSTAASEGFRERITQPGPLVLTVP